MLRLYNNRADHATPFPGTGAAFLGRGFPWQKSPAVRARLGIWSRPYPPQTKLSAPVHAEKWCVPILLHKFTHPLSKKLWQNAHPNGKQKLTVPPNPVTIGLYGNPASVVGIAQRRGRMQNTVWLACTDRRDLSAAARELLAHALALATPPALVYGAHGKPELEQGGLRISLSHTRGAVACAVSAFPVGTARPEGPGLEAACRAVLYAGGAVLHRQPGTVPRGLDPQGGVPQTGWAWAFSAAQADQHPFHPGDFYPDRERVCRLLVRGTGGVFAGGLPFGAVQKTRWGKRNHPKGAMLCWKNWTCT